MYTNKLRVVQSVAEIIISEKESAEIGYFRHNVNPTHVRITTTNLLVIRGTLPTSLKRVTKMEIFL